MYLWLNMKWLHYFYCSAFIERIIGYGIGLWLLNYQFPCICSSFQSERRASQFFSFQGPVAVQSWKHISLLSEAISHLVSSHLKYIYIFWEGGHGVWENGETHQVSEI